MLLFAEAAEKQLTRRGDQGQHRTARRAQTAQKHLEAIDENIPFMTSYLTFYLKGHIGIHSDHVDLTIPNTIFGLIPLGKQQSQHRCKSDRFTSQ